MPLSTPKSTDPKDASPHQPAPANSEPEQKQAEQTVTDSAVFHQAKFAPRLLSPSSILHLQRIVGNKATERILQRQINHTTAEVVQRTLDVDQIAELTKQASDAIQSAAVGGAAGKALVKVAEKDKGIDKGSVTDLVFMAEKLYGSASTLSKILASVGEADRPQVLSQAIDSGVTEKLGLPRVFMRQERYPEFAKDPANFTSYLQFVMDYANRESGKMTEEELKAFVKKVFNHQKGYDTSWDAIAEWETEKLIGGSVDSEGIVKEWLVNSPNSSPFTGINVGEKGKKTNQQWIKEEYTKADDSTRKMFWGLFSFGFVNRGNTTHEELQTFVTTNMAGIVKALNGHIDGSEVQKYLADVGDLF